MPPGWFLATVGLTFLCQTYSHPVEVNSNLKTSNFSFSAKSEKSWLWGWAWGAESTVSVVDHTPVLSFASRPGMSSTSFFHLTSLINQLLAIFGAEIRDPILGYVIPLSSFTIPCSSNDTRLSLKHNFGCPHLCINGPNQPTEAWIALIQRGKCEFVNKVREAQRLGAKAVVVGGDDPEISGNADVLVNMYSQGAFWTFPGNRLQCLTTNLNLRGFFGCKDSSDVH